uniref:Uncharacterized protein n=1 Tax=Peronospora matthiolae TaxID=2874970 RepID=A0AAV1URK7_9STRA
MSSTDDTEVDASLPPHAVSFALTAVSTVAATFLGGGFYYGMTRQKKALIEEEKSFGKTQSSKKEFKPKPANFFERRMALDKPMPPGTAAWKALLGVTIITTHDLQKRLQKTPRSHGTLLSKQLEVQEIGVIEKSAVAGDVKKGQVERTSEETVIS